ncbi:MAG: hypothetical protein RLZZ561_1416 [Pseudomonadota bacterium]|jgi:hypothetical protein
MAINWFEGGRRITKLCMGITALTGAYNAIFEYNPPVLEFSTGSPRDAWRPTLVVEDAPGPASDCVLDRSDQIPILWDFEVKPGLVRDISLCFRPNEAGEVVYFSAEEGAKNLQKVEAAIANAKAAGELDDARVLALEASRLRQNMETAQVRSAQDLTWEETEIEIFDYMDRRVADFSITPAALASIEKELPRMERERLINHVTEVLSIAAYFIGGFWLFSIVIGWIVRGFAGIPRGQDFRPAQQSDATG